ncbi:MAG: Ig-like domain-containing protein [Clostridiaceae bacterium]|nr:Ig-like domain-containing protein [Clostridiaceae bacterium]
MAEKVVYADQVPSWSIKWVAYAVKYGYTSGVDASVAPKVKFAPMQKMAATEFLVWLMNIGMGYKVGTNNSIDEARNAGIITLTQEIELRVKDALIRDDIAGILYGACKNGVCADGRTFIQSLIDAGFISEVAAIAAGFIEPEAEPEPEPEPDELEVVQVTTNNLKQLFVEFNLPLKDAGDESNYIIENDDAQAVIDEDSNFELSEDKKTVIITLTEAAAQQEVIDLTIRDIEAENGLWLDETTIEDIELKDTTLPKAVSASVVGQYTIKVVFSEPIMIPEEGDDPDQYFTVDDGDYLIEKVEKVNNDTEINITLFSSLEEGTVKVEAKPAIKDYAGFGITKTSFNIKVKEDKDGPVVVGYKNAKSTEVTLIFNEDIELLEDADADDEYSDDYLEMFYHTNKNNPASGLKVNGKELTIDFTDSKLPPGRAYIYIAEDAVQDLWGNTNARISYVVEVSKDTEPVTLLKVEQEDESSIILTFNKVLDEDTAEDIDNYTILDKNGKTVKDIIDDAVLGKDGKTVTITFTEELYGNYSIVVEHVEDLAGNVIKKTTKSFTMKDMTIPEDFDARIYNPGKKGQTLKVNFNDTMATDGRYSVLDLEKYEIVVGSGKSFNLSDIKGVTIKSVDNDRAVEIRIPSYEDAEKKKNPERYVDYYDFSDTADYVKGGVSYISEELIIARVADASGNKTASNLNYVDIALSGQFGLKNDKDAVALTDKNTITITLNDKITTYKSGDFEDAVYYYNEKTGKDVPVRVTRARHTVNSDGLSVITLTLSGWNSTEVSFDGKTLKVKVTNADSRNSYGETVYIPETTVVDKAAPEVVSVVFINSTTIKVILSEDIDSKTAAADSKNGFSVSGGSAQLTKAIVDGNEITLIGENLKNTTDVSYNQVFGLADAAGNVLKSFTITDVLD